MQTINKHIQLLLKENKLSFKLFFDSFYPALVVFAQCYVYQKEIAEDFSQDAFIKMYESDNKFENLDNIKAFLYTLTRNNCLNYIKHNKVEEKYRNFVNISSEAFFKDTVVEQETYRLIYNAIETLPKKSKAIIELSLNGLKNSEIAQELGVSLNTIKTLKLRSYKTLREILKDHKLAIIILANIFS
jgi:RNA polymerase sigma-70 factor (ECF subfamily)